MSQGRLPGNIAVAFNTRSLSFRSDTTDGYLEMKIIFLFLLPIFLIERAISVYLLLYKIVVLAGILADVEQARGLQRFAQWQIIIPRGTLDHGVLTKLANIIRGQ